MVTQLWNEINRLERENRALVDQNAKLTDIARSLSNIIDEQYILIGQYASMSEAEGFAPLFQSMQDVTEKMKEVDS